MLKHFLQKQTSWAYSGKNQFQEPSDRKVHLAPTELQRSQRSQRKETRNAVKLQGYELHVLPSLSKLRL